MKRYRHAHELTRYLALQSTAMMSMRWMLGGYGCVSISVVIITPLLIQLLRQLNVIFVKV